MRLARISTAIAVLVLVLAVRPAAADTVITGSVGRVFSGDLENGELSYGAAIGFMGDGLLGFEVEGTYSPNVFGDTPDGTNNITTLMGNVVLSTPASQSFRIYASGGVGLMKFRVPDADAFFDIDRNDFGMNAGAGVLVRLGDRFGIRGDARYFRDLRTTDSADDFDVSFGGFHYWRGSVGLTLSF